MIRLIEKSDYPAIYEIYKWYVDNSDAIFDLVPAEYEKFSQMLEQIQENYPLLGAFYEDELIGYAYYHEAFSKEAYQYDAELTIYFKEGSHHGLARPLYEKLEEIMKKQNIRWIISCITDTNIESIEFHKKLGFDYQGHLEDSGLKNGKWLGVVWYAKSITEAQDYLKNNLKFIPFKKEFL